MTYDNLFEDFKEAIPEGMKFYEKKMKECDVDETDGKHVIFAMVIVPYIFHVVQNKEEEIIKKVFCFLEEMAICEDIKVQEVLDFTIEGARGLFPLSRMLCARRGYRRCIRRKDSRQAQG